jgi:16S rRNA (uracil1498-N3)-methyltransferase
MHRFYISLEDWNPSALRLAGAEAHHARDVLRMRVGEKLVIFNGRGREITAEIVDLGSNEIGLKKLHESETPPLQCRIVLGQAIPKGKNMDLIVQKAVEIGAAEIAPIVSDRTIVQVDSESAAQKQLKWQQIAIEAAKQCGQNWLPYVHAPRKLSDFLSAVEAGLSPAESSAAQPTRLPLRKNIAPFDLQLIGSLQPGAQHLKKVLAGYSGEHQHRPRSVLMLVGPEGDFTPAELALARRHGCQPITLGPIILRVETAAIYCLSILSYELLDLAPVGTPR